MDFMDFFCVPAADLPDDWRSGSSQYYSQQGNPKAATSDV